MRNEEIESLKSFCEQKLDLPSIKLGEEYFYQSLPLCVIDSVFSIGVKYKGVQNTVGRYCSKFEVQRYRHETDGYPPRLEQESLHIFLKNLEGFNEGELADDVFGSRHRTSSRSGILKARAVVEFASVLQQFGIDYFQDIPPLLTDSDRLRNFEKAIQGIKGQASGISTSYFFMLAGSDNLIKPDRMVLRFLGKALDRPWESISLREAQELVSGAVRDLRPSYPYLNARLLDYGIWSFQRQQGKGV